MGHLEEYRLLSTSGLLGYGFPEASLEAGMARQPHMIGVDGGSTDPGPYYLGSGKCVNSRMAMKRDLRLMLRAARKQRIPLIIGSCGGAGGEPHLQTCVAIVREIAREDALHFRLADHPFRAGQGLGEARAQGGPREGAAQRQAARRRDDRPRHAHRGHDGRRTVPARAGRRRRRRARRTVQRSRAVGRLRDARRHAAGGVVVRGQDARMRRHRRVAQGPRLPADERQPRGRRARSDESDPLVHAVLRRQSQPARECDAVLSHRARRTAGHVRLRIRGGQRARGTRERHGVEKAALYDQARRRRARRLPRDHDLRHARSDAGRQRSTSSWCRCARTWR